MIRLVNAMPIRLLVSRIIYIKSCENIYKNFPQKILFHPFIPKTTESVFACKTAKQKRK